MQSLEVVAILVLDTVEISLIPVPLKTCSSALASFPSLQRSVRISSDFVSPVRD